jgi:hypothetical protein
MKPHAQAVREAQAWDRILGAVTRQAQAAGVKTEGLDATHRDPSLQRLFRMEALAAHLEGVEAAQAPKPAKAEGKAEGKVSK